jgi:hypothetical protein
MQNYAFTDLLLREADLRQPLPANIYVHDVIQLMWSGAAPGRKRKRRA